MKVGKFILSLSAAIVVSIVSGTGLPVLAQGGQTAARHDHDGVENSRTAGPLIQAVREATERFKDVNVAEAEGYQLQFGCVSGPDAGAMGMHFVNGPLVGDGEIDVNKPEIVIYEPQPNGRLRLIGADYLVFADVWNATHSSAPELMGQLFHLFEAPNRFGLPNFYTLHVWAWKDSPTGSFVNWNTNVSCDAFKGPNR
ncbi:MAG TPA: hypothetical protein VH583_25775 [Vicinamibacterales bacterium]|jgi:hypothetical protein